MRSLFFLTILVSVCVGISRDAAGQNRERPETHPLSPEDSLKSMQPRAGFRVDLVAAEPLVRDPIDLAWGPDGKLWVVEMADYPLGMDDQGKPGGRVRYLEDGDGDGKYDKSTLFLDEIQIPTSVLPWRDGVLITAAPEVFYAEDSDGDGTADVKRVLYSGFGEGNQQHRVNGLAWGLDNWIYVANGDSGGKIRSTRTEKTVDVSGRDLRIRPDTGDIESQIGQTQHGRNRDDWGNWLGCNNSFSWHFVLTEHYLRRNPHVAPPSPRQTLADVAEVFPISQVYSHYSGYQSPGPGQPHRMTSGCGILLYRDSLFGAGFSNSAFYSEPVHNLVHRFLLEPKGVTYRYARAADEQQSEFLASRDTWFRPTALRTGPDGALWIADMYRRVIEHPEWIDDTFEKQIDLREGHERGRIYRVYPVDAELRPVPRFAKDMAIRDLVAALETDNGWQRDLVHQMLLWREDKSAVPHLKSMAAESARPQARLHALACLDGLGALTPAMILPRLRDEHPGVRRHAVRLSEPFLKENGDAGRQLGAAILELEKDPDPHVQMQLAYSLGEWPDARAGELLGRMAIQAASDPNLLAAVMSSAVPHVDGMVRLAVHDEQARRGPVFDQLLQVVARAQTESMPQVLQTLTRKSGDDFAAWQFTSTARFLENLEKAGTPYTKAFGSAEKSDGLRKQLEEIVDRARTLVADRKTDVALRVGCVQLLGRLAEKREADFETLAAQLEPGNASQLQTEAISRFASIDDARVPELLLASWDGSGPTARGSILEALLTRASYTEALLDRMAEQRELRIALSSAQRQTLLKHPTESLRDRAKEVLAAVVNPDRAVVIDKFRPALHLAGAATHGAETFSKLCASCHKLGNLGKDVGPKLIGLSDKSPEGFLVHILDPNRAVEAKYMQYVAVTRDARVLTGMLADETGPSVTLIDAEGNPHPLVRDDLESIQSSATSLMPEGLEAELDHQKMADLLAFLAQHTLPRKAFPNNQPRVVEQAEDTSLTLAAATSAVFGPSLVFEQRYRNLGYWSSAQDRAEWEFELTQGGEFDVWIDWALHDNNVGDRVRLEFGGSAVVAFDVPGTGTWDEYQWRRFGSVELEVGAHRLVARSDRPVEHSAMIDLRTVKLLPPGSDAPAATEVPAESPDTPWKQVDGNNPDLVRASPENSGVLDLLAGNGEIYGDRIAVYVPQRCIGWWMKESDHVIWNVEVAQAGTYDVQLEWSIPDNWAGNRFSLFVDGQKRMTATIPTTGDFSNFKVEKFGQTKLNAGRTRIAMRPAGAINGELADLRRVRLIKASAAPEKPKVVDGNKPELVRPSSENPGVLDLLAGNGEIYGDRIAVYVPQRCIGWWMKKSDHVIWNVEVAQSGIYDVELEWSIPDKWAGNGFSIFVDGEKRMTATVPTTGDFSNFKLEKFGQMKLEAGRARIAMRPVGAINGELADVRRVRLIRAETPKIRFQGQTCPVGVAKIDVTPTHPVLLAGYGGRPGEHVGVDTKIWARALAFGEEPSLVIAVDNCGVPAPVVQKIATRLFEKYKIPRERVVIMSTHTHNAPTLTGYATVVWGGRATPEQMERVHRYTGYLSDKIVEVAGSALSDRKPARLAWTQGRVTFGGNRRTIQTGSWRGFGFQRDGPVDHSLPVLAAQDESGKLLAVWTNYACHCTTIGGRNHIHGDWAGYSNDAIEKRFTDAIALTTVGCGADIGPQPSGNADVARAHGQSIADEVWSLYSGGRFLDVPTQIAAKFRHVELPFDKIPGRDHWERQTGAFYKYHAEQQLKRLESDGKLPTHLRYPITTWEFGDALGIIFLAGEVVVDYSVRLKRELDWRRLWINGWANDVPCYIPSKRLLREGGYEVDFSQIYYNQPARFAPETEDIIVEAIHDMLSDTYEAGPAEIGAPYHDHPSVRPSSASNRLSYLNSQDTYYLGNAVPGGASSRWRAEAKLGELVVLDLERVRTRVEVIRSLVGRVNRRELDDHVLQARGRREGVWRVVDLNVDGFLDVVESSGEASKTFLWSEKKRDWIEAGEFPLRLPADADAGIVWGVLRGRATVIARKAAISGAWQFDGTDWTHAPELLNGLESEGARLFSGLGGRDIGARLWDLDGDGDCEFLVGNPTASHGLRWNEQQERWYPLPFGIPEGIAWVDDEGGDTGLRLQDVDRDGHDDLILGSHDRFAVHVFLSMARGWSEPIVAGVRTGDGTADVVPAIASANGRPTGAWYDAENRWVVSPEDGTRAAIVSVDLAAQLEFQRRVRERVKTLLAENTESAEKLKALQSHLVDGFLKVTQNQGGEDNWYNFTGGMHVRPYIRQQQKGATLAWETPPMAVDDLGEKVTIVFIGGVGWISQPQTGGFDLLIGNTPALSFDVTLKPTTWTSADEKIELFYFPTWTSNVDSGGFFYLTVPRSRLITGKRLQLGVRSKGEGSRRWFSLDKLQNSTVLQGLVVTALEEN